MKINISQLVSREVGTTATSGLEEELPIPDQGHAAVQGQIKLTRLDQSILANFDVVAGLTLNCDKCLESFRHQMPLQFDREYWLDRAKTEPDELVVDDQHLDTDPAIIQEILINLPLQAVCKPDCKGLDPVTGVNLNE